MKKLSIIIPAYNCEKYLQDCINSIYNQTISDDVEVILVNDASTDNTLSIANRYKENSNFRIINLEKNAGVSNARNIGIENATGKYIFFLDSDDMLISGSIKIMMDYIENENYDIIKFTFKHYIKNIPYLTYKLHNEGEFIINEEYNDRIFQTFLNYYDFHSTCGQLILLEVAKKNRFDTNLILAEDMSFNLNMYFKVNTICIDKTPVIYYRFNEQSATHYCDNKKIIDEAVSCYKGYSNLYKYDKYKKYKEQIDERIINTIVSIFKGIYSQDISEFEKMYNEFLERIDDLKKIDKLNDIVFIENECKNKNKKNKLRRLIKKLIS